MNNLMEKYNVWRLEKVQMAIKKNNTELDRIFNNLQNSTDDYDKSFYQGCHTGALERGKNLKTKLNNLREKQNE